MAETPAPEKPAPPVPQSRVGKFIQTYHTFLSTFVIGAAGLIATSIWQYRQSEIARRQAESEQAIAKTNAENQWRIERAEILAKNLQVLAARGAGSADQRYGVLLSLTRGAIMDPELAVSYALELGKDNAEYMKSVLTSTNDKDYAQLAHAFALTCEQRYGLGRQVELCKGDELGPRSDAIARLVSEDAEAWVVTAAPDSGGATIPMTVLREEREVQKDPARYSWLFKPAIDDLYQHQQWTEYRRFAGYSTGAHVVAALALARARTGELSANGSGTGAETLHAEERAWLLGYTLGKTCDDDCRARFAGVMVSGLAEAQGDYDEVLRKMLMRPRVESGAAVERLHTRLVRCQVDAADEARLRDGVLVGALVEALGQPKPDPLVIDNLTDLLASVTEPTDATARAAWNAALARLAKVMPDRYKRFVERHTAAAEARKTPPPILRKVSFCKAGDQPVEASQPE